MPPALWFLVGCATSLTAVSLARSVRRRRHTEAQRGKGAGEAARTRRRASAEQLELRLARTLLDDTNRDLASLASSIGSELATAASSVDGHGQLLCEAIGSPRLVAARMEHFTAAVRRLRMLAEKILSFSQVPALEARSLDLRTFLAGIARDIEDTGRGLKVELQMAEILPDALAAPRALRNAMLFIVETLMHLESRACRLLLRVYPEMRDEREPRIEVEISAEAERHALPDAPAKRAVQLGYIAARNLLEAQGARLSFDQLEGLSVTCYISLPAAAGEPPATGVSEAGPPARRPRHLYGGVLILEEDPEIRNMIASELAPSGRKLVTCVDGASARSLIEATAERFEMVVVEQSARVESGESIARLIAERNPDVKILVLANGCTPLGDLPGCDTQVIVKPFGIHELREAFHELLSEPSLG